MAAKTPPANLPADAAAIAAATVDAAAASASAAVFSGYAFVDWHGGLLRGKTPPKATVPERTWCGLAGLELGRWS